MQSSVSANISNELSIRQVDLSVINSDKLRKVLEYGLKGTFENVSVEWVKCPNLTRKPFNLAAPGLCGQTAFMEIGDLSYLKPKPIIEKIYNINKILQRLNRDCNNSFIFGAGISARRNGTLGELVMNMTISPFYDDIMISNRNSIISMDTSENKCNVEMAPIDCRIHGTFFLCEGAVGSVLEVRVKGYHSYTDEPSVPGFIDAMQDIIREKFGPDEFVGLGGVYITNDIPWKHRLDQHSWEPWFSPMNPEKHRYCNVNVPEAIITTFSNSTTGLLQYSPEFPPIKLTGKSTHCLSHHNAGDHFLTENTADGVEYLGYFCPAQKVYRIDEPLTKFPNLQ